MTGALESEWSRGRNLGVFFFVSVVLFLTHMFLGVLGSKRQYYQLFANPLSSQT